jgi:hypothetical protein
MEYDSGAIRARLHPCRPVGFSGDGLSRIGLNGWSGVERASATKTVANMLTNVSSLLDMFSDPIEQ